MVMRVGILGASGYTGGELVRLLACHPEVTITHVTSERYAGQPFSAVYPHLTGVGDSLICQAMDAQQISEACDVAFCALPHVTSMTVVPTLLENGLKVIDLSADFRLKDAQVYADWYGTDHTAPALLAQAAYGLPELHRAEIAKAQLIANPGCYPTSIILALTPLLREGLIDPARIIADSKSGVSGAGRSPGQATLFSEVSEGFKPYKVTGHRHIPEIEQELSGVNGSDIGAIRFTPHLLPQIRGIFSTIYTIPLQDRTEEEYRSVLADHYRDEMFVRVLPKGRFPDTHHVRGSNLCDIGLALDERSGTLVVMAAIDNLVKGASGAAVQNLNVSSGLPENMALEQWPLFP
ncbi:MAG: N-acetyl-gamma-glutamyl-phosphate reductase [Magnetococcales bacterium]|nr:N-acetyl-gamma-glutamyl-phosphate reductase [Magnetococcales bacterium]